MAELAKVRSSLMEFAKDMGMVGNELTSFISAEIDKHLDREERLEKERAEREAQERREIRQAEEREKERQHETRLKELDVEARRVEVEASPSTLESSGASPSADGNTITSHATGTNAMSFPLEIFSNSAEKIDTYLDRFERFASSYGLDKDKWALKLSQGLRGTAYEVYMKLPITEQNKYDTLKKALLQRFELNSEAYRKQFRRARRDIGETFAQFASRLESYLQKWRTLGNFPESLEGIQEMIIMEQLKDTMTPDMRRFLAEHGAENLESLLTLAERFQGALAEAQSTRRKYTDMPAKASTHPCSDNHPKSSGFSHKAQNTSQTYNRIKQERTSTNQETGRKWCKVCKTNTHHTQECKIKPAPQHAAFIQTKSPKKNSMRQTNSLNRPSVTDTVKVNGQHVLCLYDTGLEFDAVVASSLVDPGQVTPDTVELRGATKGDKTMTLQIANIQVESRFVSGQIRAAVMDDPIYDLILGCRYVFLGEPKEPLVIAAVTTRSKAASEQEPAPVQNPLPQELKNAQTQDTTLASCFKKLPFANTPLQKGNFYMKLGLIYRRAGNIGLEHGQLVVPSTYRNQILEMGHALPFSGHMGQNATMQRISAHYYWPGMNADIIRFVKSCAQCQRVAPKHWTSPATLGEMPIIGTPFERVAVDIIGPLLRTKRRNRCILTLVDTCTMWGEAIALPSSDSVHVAEALVSIFTRLGFPRQILTDNGSQFKGKLAEEVFRVFRTQHIHTSPYHPQSNGQVERFNGTLITMLRKLAQEKPETWDLFLPAALFAYREVPHSSTGLSPATLLFGRPIKGPLEALLRAMTDESADDSIVTASKYVQELKERLKVGWEMASTNLRRARSKYAKHYNKSAKDRELHIGEKVLLLLPSGNNKLQIGWQGPFEVVQKISRTNYKISKKGKHKIYHVNLLKKYVERPNPEPAHLMTLAVATEVDNEDKIYVEYPLRPQESHKDVQISSTLGSAEGEQVKQLLEEHSEVLTDRPGLTNLVEFEMKVTDPTPVRVKTYPIPYAKASALQEEIEQLLNANIISKSESPYSASVVLLQKPSGEARLCIDYRRLNAVTEFQPEPLPDPNGLFTKLSKAKFFTKIDLSKGYYQIPVKKEIRPLLAFSTSEGHYQFNVLPFGLSNAPGIFTRMMRKLLTPLQNNAIHNFMDDILISTSTFEEHLEALAQLLQRLKETGLTARPSKCLIGFKELEFLGHTITHGCMWPVDKNVEKIKQAPRPITKKDTRSFLSLCAYYQRFIQGFNTLTAPLTDLTRKGQPEKVVWTPDCEEVYATLKHKLTSRPILRLPDLAKPFVLRVDACNIGIGSSLMQTDDNNPDLLFPVAYASRRLNSAERNYSTIEKECLALVWAVQKHQPYLYGVKFTVQSDHAPLMFLAASKKLNARLMRWALLLQPYSFKVEYIPGKINVGADFLSRHTLAELDTIEETPSDSASLSERIVKVNEESEV